MIYKTWILEKFLSWKNDMKNLSEKIVKKL